MDKNEFIRHAHASRLIAELESHTANLKEALGDVIQYINMIDKTAQQLSEITKILFQENEDAS